MVGVKGNLSDMKSDKLSPANKFPKNKRYFFSNSDGTAHQKEIIEQSNIISSLW